jgi:hypothetical protein
MARAQFDAADSIGQHTTGQARRDLRIAQALWAEFLSWIDEQDCVTTAAAWLHHAHHHAEQAEAPALTSYILMRLSQQAVEQSDPRRAAALADQALREPRLPARTRALCLVRQAHAFALGGDETASTQRIKQAYRLADRAASGPGLPIDIGAHCTASYVVAHEAQCRLLLGQPAVAVNLYDDLLRHWPAQWRLDEGLWRAGLAAAHVASSNPEQAATEATRALGIAADLSSTRTLRALATTAVALRQHPDVPEATCFVSAFRHAILGPCDD